MKQTWAHKQLLTRKFIAAVVLCLFVFKGLAFLGMTASLASDPQSANPVITSAVLGTHCEAGKEKSDPLGQHVHNTECCLFCSSPVRDVVGLDASLLTIVIASLSPQKELPSALISFEEPTKLEPVGYLSSWSATAPPRA
ncbi:MAG: hypothetical protein ACKOEW_06480 [Methylocystis sp.]